MRYFYSLLLVLRTIWYIIRQRLTHLAPHSSESDTGPSALASLPQVSCPSLQGRARGEGCPAHTERALREGKAATQAWRTNTPFPWRPRQCWGARSPEELVQGVGSRPVCTLGPEGVSMKEDLTGRRDVTGGSHQTTAVAGTGSNPRPSSVPNHTALVPVQATPCDVTAQMAPGQQHTASHACETDSKTQPTSPHCTHHHGQ